MRMDMRLHGMTSSGRPCLMDVTVYSISQRKFMKEVQEQSREGPWYFAGTSELVSETDAISVERVERLTGAGNRKPTK